MIHQDDDHAQRTLCACQRHCGDVPESQDDGNAICKGLPAPKQSLVEVVLVDRREVEGL